MDPELEQQTAAQTQEGAAEQQPAERQPTPRELAMAAIVVRRDEDGETAAEDSTPELAAQHADPVQEQLAAQLDQPTVLADDLGKYRVKVKIDGVEHEVSVADMQRQFQINGAAERRLQQANALLEQAKKTASPPAGVAPAAHAADSPSAPTAKAAGEVAKNIVGALLEGDDAKAIAALEEALAGRQNEPTPIDQGQLAAQLTPAIRQQIVNESALDAFMTANADLMGDPHLVDLTGRFIDAEMATGKAYPDALQAAGQQTRDWIAKLGGAKPTVDPQQTTRDKKLEQKAGMDVIPALNKTASSAQEPEPNTSTVLDQMRKARGLPT